MAEITGLALFLDLQKSLIEEQNVKDTLAEDIKALDEVTRRISTLLQSIHQRRSSDEIVDLCKKAHQHFETVQTIYGTIATKVPNGEYYKYVSQWQSVSNKLCFLASLLIFVERGTLSSRNQVMEMLGVEVDAKKGFHVDLEEYLCGLLSLASELSRLAVNSVIAGDYTRPLSISKFVSELESGFRLLNLKNDFLRKKYDGLKYDVKKIEQVVYDLKIRGLVPEQVKYEEET